MLVQSVVDYAIFMLDPSGHVASWNPGAERIKGYTAAEILGQHFSRFYTEDDRAAGVPEQALRAAAETGRFAAENWRVRKDGTRFWAAVVIDPIWHQGELIGYAKVTRDMTEQRQTQLARLESERRFRLLVQGVVDYAIFMLDPNGNVTNWNAGAERIKGYSEAEIVGRHFSVFYTKEDIALGRPGLALETARREGRFGAEAWRVRKDGSRFWANVVIDPIYDGGELIGFAKVTRDLTERREAELQLEQSRALLAQSQKMDAVGQLTGGIAHDFNNMLTGITGSLELMRARIAQGRLDGIEELITAAQSSANRAASLTHRLLAFSRRQTLDPKPIEPNQLIADMLDLIQRSIGEDIQVETQLAPELWPTLCDANQLESALLNLCINARDAMPRGGRLRIQTANRTLDAREAGQLDMKPGEYVAVRVIDTGTGMSEEVAAKAFEPFFTTKPMGQGTGLGLSMVYGFARQSGGTTRLHSWLGAGTAVELLLPRHHAAPAPAPSPPVPELPAAEGGETVLVIDDEPTVLMLIREVLEELGYSTLEAADGVSGLDRLQAHPAVDLLITDVGLPGGMNGPEVAAAARRKRPGLKVLFITGYAESKVLDPASFEPGMQVLTKPFALDTLAARIKALLAS
ncbi:MAG TPA: PAS domain S-box protein [Acetobacteraceae bacterium]|nr:PAS domain S-box protein [Acetobacteraceae bacterium]